MRCNTLIKLSMEQEDDLQEVLNPEEVAEPISAEESFLETDELTKAQQLAQNYKIRAEKAERENKQLKTPKHVESATPTNAEISLKDQYALMEAKVPIEDLDEVIDYASHKKIPIAEALKTTVIKAVLSERAEQRATAQAASTGPAKRATSKASDESLLEKLETGDLPEEDIDRAVKARLERKMQT